MMRAWIKWSSNLLLFGTLGALSIGGCKDKPNLAAAPAASSLEQAKPASAAATKFAIDAGPSKASWVMEAHVEKIFGEIAGGLSGELFVDAADLGKTTGLVKVDLSKLDLFQQRRDDEKDTYGERSRSEKQNRDARGWLEIDDKAPEAARQQNLTAQFRVTKLEAPSGDPSKLTGAERKITATAVGELLLHGHKAEKRVKIEATFSYDGDKPKKVHVTTLEPLIIDLLEFDVRPRDPLGKTLADLAPKVAKEAPVTLDVTATAQ